MIRPIRVDDTPTSRLIWLDWNDTSAEELNEFVCSNFDVINIPTGINISVRCNKYYVSYFKTDKSSTGYAAMFVNKDRNIYKKRVGYI